MVLIIVLKAFPGCKKRVLTASLITSILFVFYDKLFYLLLTLNLGNLILNIG